MVIKKSFIIKTEELIRDNYFFKHYLKFIYFQIEVVFREIYV